MIYTIFIISILLYILFLFLKKKKENFILKERKSNYYLFGNLGDNYNKYLQLYKNKNNNSNFNINIKGCENYDVNDFKDNDDFNKLINHNNNTTTYDICGVELKLLLEKSKEKINSKENSVIILSYGIKDIENIHFIYKKNNPNKNIPKKKQESDYLIAMEKTFLSAILNFNKNIKVLIINLKIDNNECDYNCERYKIWNKQLKKYQDNINKYITNKNSYVKIIDQNKKYIDNNGKVANDGIPEELHHFICKNEKCAIANENCVKLFPNIFN